MVSGKANAQTGAVFITKDSDGSSLLELSSSTKKGTFTINEDMTIKIVIYLSIGTALTEATQIEVYDIQLEQGSTATEYEEYVKKEIYVKNDNGVYDLFDKVEEPEYCQVSLKGIHTLPVSSQWEHTKIPFDRVDTKLGDFTLTDGSIKVGKNISKVRVTVNVAISGVAKEAMYAIVIKTGTTSKAFAYLQFKSYINPSYTCIIDVKENDEIYTTLQNQETYGNTLTVYGNSAYVVTNMSVEKIA